MCTSSPRHSLDCSVKIMLQHSTLMTMTARVSQLLPIYPTSTYSILLPRGCTFLCGLNDSVSSLSPDRDLLELNKLKIHLIHPRNHKNCNIVPVGILPLLPLLNPPSPFLMYPHLRPRPQRQSCRVNNRRTPHTTSPV